MEVAEVDWVSGAFTMTHPEVLAQTSLRSLVFCIRRSGSMPQKIKALGYKVEY